MIRKYTLIITLCLFHFQGLIAQNPLSLSDAVQIALANNFDILISKEEVKIASNNNTAGNAGQLPTVNVSVNQNNSLNDQNNPASFVQGQFITNSLQGGIDVNWILFNGLKIKMNKQRLGLLQQQSEGNAALVVENTIQAVILSYYNTVLQQERLKLFDELKTLSREEYEYHRYKQELGAESSFDVLTIKSAYYTDSTNYLNQQLVLRNAQRELNYLISVPTETSFSLTDTIIPSIEVYNYEVLKEKMQSNNTTLRNQFINQEILNAQTRMAKGDLYPVISTNIGTSTGWNRFAVEDMSREGTSTNYYANFAVQYRLYDGGKFRTAVQNATMQEEIGSLNIEKMSLSLEKDLRNNYETYNTQILSLGIARENLGISKSNLELGGEKFKLGSINSFNYRDLQLQYLVANISLLESAYNLIQTHTELVRITGGIIDSVE